MEPKETAAQWEACWQATAEVASHIDGLVAVISEVNSDFHRLPLFLRPVARRAFQSKSGHSIRDWQSWATTLAQQLSDLMQLSADQRTRNAMLAAFLVEHRGLDESLRRLDACLAALPTEANRFTADPMTLSVIEEKSARQRAVVARLRKAVSGVQAVF